MTSGEALVKNAVRPFPSEENYSECFFLCFCTNSMKKARKIPENNPTTVASETINLLFGLMGLLGG